MNPYNYTIWDNITILVNPSLGIAVSNQSVCDWAILFPNGYILTVPETIPFSILALLIGVYCGNAIKKLNTAESLVYSVTFYLYGIMMTDAMLADTFFAAWETSTNVYQQMFALLLALIDASLTSTIALSFGWNALVDAGFLDEKSWKTWFLMITSYLGITGLWVYAMATMNFNLGYILYTDVIMASCGMYLLGEFVSIVIRKRTDGLVYLVAAGLCGVTGIQGIAGTPPIFCKIFTPYYGDTGLWFSFSDLAMFFVFLYFKERANAEKKKNEERVYVTYQQI